ncbi:MAG: hypothetical protein OQK04_05810, partial [Kangiellaceae bacterium]|nr:hypothetical protein [Kangiellaceae bacterium]
MKSLLTKIAVGLLALIVISTISSYFFFRYQVDQMLGGNTEIVDVEQFKATAGKIAITNVGILSSDSASILPEQTVLIEGEKIVSVGRSINVPDDYFVVSGKGRYLIPGLIDSHVHIKKSSNDFLLYVANGITHIGEMTGMEHHFDYLKEIRSGKIGPTMFIASPKVNSHKSLKATFRSLFEKRHQNFINPVEGREAVRKFKALGYGAIKLSSDLDAEIYFAINDEAMKIGIPVIGHLPVGLTLSDLYQSGQSQLAHIDSITHNLVNEFGGLYAENSESFLQHVEAQADEIAATFKEREIALASTVWLHKSRPYQDFNLPVFFKTIEIEYQNPGWLEG